MTADCLQTHQLRESGLRLPTIMANRQKSLFRGPGVKHYALIHRSVRDPALNEDGTTDRVLAELPKKQVSDHHNTHSLIQS